MLALTDRFTRTLMVGMLAAVTSLSCDTAPATDTNTDPPGATPEQVDEAALVRAICRTDADCAACADYHTGCTCRAVIAGDPFHQCGGDVACFVDPCRDQRAICIAGRCLLDGPSAQAASGGARPTGD
jgi:hypothetical protein